MTEKEEIKMYDGKVTMTFYSRSHQYRVDGKRMPSVTAITGQIDKSNALLRWGENLSRAYFQNKDLRSEEITTEVWEEGITQYRSKRDEAGAIGTEVHEWASEWIKRTKVGRQEMKFPKDPKIMNGIIAFLKWVKDNDIKFLETEKMIYSKKRGYVGTFDILYSYGKSKKLYVGDFKTGKHVGAEAYFQLAGYAIAYEEEYKKKISGLQIQHLNKETGEFKVYDVSMKEAKAGFIILSGLKNSIREIEKIIRKQQ